MINVGGLIGISMSTTTIENSIVNIEFRLSGVVGGFIAEFSGIGQTLTVRNC